jgi:WS/DGAT/MGAT family acyltransferase
MQQGKTLEPMSSVDGFWLSMDEPTNLMVITGLMEFDELLDYDAVCALLEERLLCHHRFRQKVVWPTSTLGRPFWDEDLNFDLQNHVIRMALPTPRDKATLQRMISDLSIIPLDKNKPLWRAHIIENYGTGCVLFFRIHHAIADGIALIRLLLSMADMKPNSSFRQAREAVEKPKTKKPRRKGSLDHIAGPLDLFARAARATLKTAGSTGGMVYDELTKVAAYPPYLTRMIKLYGRIGLESSTVLAKLALMPSDSKTSLKGKLGLRKCVCWSAPLPLPTVKEIGAYFRSTVNDVLMAAVAGALREYLLERGDDLEDAELRVAIPVNVRSESPEVELGNQFSLVLLSLPIHLEDPVRRLRETRKRMRTLKESADAFVGFQMLKIMGIPPTGVTKRAAGFFSNKFTGVLSNVPGPREHLYFTDRKIKNMMFWVPRSGDVALGVSIISYAGSVTLGIATDCRVASDPEKITVHFSDKFAELLKLARMDVLERAPAGRRAEARQSI